MNAPPLFIPVVLGSIRAQRRSARPARLLHERVMAGGHLSELLDLRELALPAYDETEPSERHPGVQAFRASLAQADGVLWLTPEYNHGYSAATKNAVDYLHREIRRKPVAVCGLSIGALGGARAVEQLKLVLIELHALPIRDSVYFADARGLYDVDGTLQRPDLVGRADEVIAELAWYATALRWARQNVPLPEKCRGRSQRPGG